MSTASLSTAIGQRIRVEALLGPQPRRTLLQMVLFGVVYGITAKLGLDHSSLAPNVTLIWPPTGISLFVVLRYGYRLWPGIILGDLLGNAGTGAPLGSVFGIASGNILETLVSAWLLQRVAGMRLELDRVRDVVALLVLGSACAALSAFVGPASLALGGALPWDLYWSVWLQWLMGDATGVIVLTPLLLAWSAGRGSGRTRLEWLEIALLAGVLLLVCEAVFGGLGWIQHGYYPASLALFPLAVWAALRFGLKGATAVTLVVSVAAIWGTVQGRGPFVVDAGVDSLVRWWVFVNVITVTGLLLAASRAERAGAQAQLQRERDFVSSILDAEGALVVVLDRAGHVLRANRAFAALTGAPASDIAGRPFLASFIGPAHWPKVEANAELLRLRVANVVRHETDLRRRQGEPRRVSWSCAGVHDAAGQLDYIIATGIDITERTEALAALRRARRELEARVAERTQELARTNASLREEIGERRRLEHEIIRVAEHEQKRIGQELHDGLGQHLTAAAFLCEVLAGRLQSRALPEAGEADRIERMVSDAVAQTRLLARGLFPVELEADGLTAALERLAANAAQLYGLDCRFECHAPVPMLDDNVAINLYRIAQEAVTNAVKHSAARCIHVTLAQDGAATSLAIADDGSGLPPVRRDGMGLRIMAYRATLIGARLELENGAAGGLRVQVVLPELLENENAGNPHPADPR